MSQDNNTQETHEEDREINHQTSNLPPQENEEQSNDERDYDAEIERLRKSLEKAEAEKERVKAESIERRFKLKESRSTLDAQAERLEALEKRFREADLKSARLEAITKHSLPADAAELLGNDPDKVEANAEALAQLLSSKKSNDSSPRQGGNDSGSGRAPSGGRNPGGRSSYDVNAIINDFVGRR